MFAFKSVRVFRTCPSLGRLFLDDRGAVTVDYVVLTALVVVLMVGFSQPLIEALQQLIQGISQAFADAPMIDADDWPSND